MLEQREAALFSKPVVQSIPGGYVLSTQSGRGVSRIITDRNVSIKIFSLIRRLQGCTLGGVQSAHCEAQYVRRRP